MAPTLNLIRSLPLTLPLILPLALRLTLPLTQPLSLPLTLRLTLPLNLALNLALKLALALNLTVSLNLALALIVSDPSQRSRPGSGGAPPALSPGGRRNVTASEGSACRPWLSKLCHARLTQSPTRGA